MVNIFKPGQSGLLSCPVETVEDPEDAGDVLSSLLGIGRSALDDNLVNAFLQNNILGTSLLF